MLMNGDSLVIKSLARETTFTILYCVAFNKGNEIMDVGVGLSAKEIVRESGMTNLYCPVDNRVDFFFSFSSFGYFGSERFVAFQFLLFFFNIQSFYFRSSH